MQKISIREFRYMFTPMACNFSLLTRKNTTFVGATGCTTFLSHTIWCFFVATYNMVLPDLRKGDWWDMRGKVDWCGTYTSLCYFAWFLTIDLLLSLVHVRLWLSLSWLDGVKQINNCMDTNDNTMLIILLC